LLNQLQSDQHVAVQEIRANAHETRDSLQQFLFAGSLGLSLSISLQFTLLQKKNCQKSTKKHLFLEFEVIQGHRC